MSQDALIIDNQWLTFDSIKNFILHSQQIAISTAAEALVIKCRAYLDKKMELDEAVYYGINTGFGFLQNVQIDKNQIEQLQYNLLMSHACGLGDEVPKEIVRLMLMLKIKKIGRASCRERV